MEARTPHIQRKVAVVGAGAAGLTAAYELTRAGHDVTVLEASPRPGGRIRTFRDFPGGLHAEAGAAHLRSHHTLTRAYAAELGTALRPVIIDAPTALLHARNSTLTFADYATNPTRGPFILPTPERGKSSAKMWRDATAPIRAVLEREGDDGWATIHASYRHLTLREFLEQAGWSDAAITMYTLTTQREPRLNSPVVDELRDIIGYADSETLEFTDGADRFTGALAHRLTDRIRYGARVTDVAHQGQVDAVTVAYRTLTGTHTVTADHVIVAVSAPIACGIDFTPSLPRAKAQALRSVAYTPGTVTAVSFRSRFWEEVPYKLDSGGTTITDRPIRRLTYPTYAPDATRRGVLRVQHMWGADAFSWSALLPEQRITQAITDLAAIHPEAISAYEHADTINWGQHLHTLGGVSLFPPGEQQQRQPVLAAPQGRVHFAGEHTSLLHGTVEGAVESGIRAAVEVHTAQP